MSVTSFIQGAVAALHHKLSSEQEHITAIRARSPSKIKESVVAVREKNIEAINSEIASLQSQIGHIPKIEILGKEYEVLSMTKFPSLVKAQYVLIQHRIYEIEFPQMPDVNRTRGNKAKAYDAYLIDWANKNPNAQVLAQVVSMFTPEHAPLSIAMEGKKQIDILGKFFKAGRFPVTRYQLLDGRVVEATCDTRGAWIYAVFPSREHADNYKQPQDWKEFWNEW